MPSSDTAKIALGTSAWSYADWRGVFYPPKLPQARLLEWYSGSFNAVEVDSTFYHSPSSSATRQWHDITPDGFTFTTKLTRTMTHEHRLRHCGPLLATYLKGLEPLGEKLGAVLIQLPAGFTLREDGEALNQFVRELPTGWRFAVEFRDPSWRTPKVLHWLQERNVALAWTDTETWSHDAEGAFEWLPRTADFIYLRLLGDLASKYDSAGKRRVERYDHLFWQRDRAIENWAVKIRHHLSDSERLFLFAANHFEGCSPLTAQRLSEALGIPLTLRDPRADDKPDAGQQLDLF